MLGYYGISRPIKFYPLTLDPKSIFFKDKFPEVEDPALPNVNRMLLKIEQCSFTMQSSTTLIHFNVTTNLWVDTFRVQNGVWSVVVTSINGFNSILLHRTTLSGQLYTYHRYIILLHHSSFLMTAEGTGKVVSYSA